MRWQVAVAVVVAALVSVAAGPVAARPVAGGRGASSDPAGYWWERTYVPEVVMSVTDSYLEALAACDAADREPVQAHAVPGAPRYGVIGDSVVVATRAANLADDQISWAHATHCGESFGSVQSSGRLDVVLAAAPDVLAMGFGTNSASAWLADPSMLPQAWLDFQALLARTDAVPCRVLFTVPERVTVGLTSAQESDLLLVERAISSWMRSIDPIRHPGVTVVDWAAITAADPTLLWDNQHLTRKGINVRVDLTLARTRHCLAPDAPAMPSAVAANGVATVWWPPLPAEEGVTAYRVRASSGQVATTSSSTIDVAGLPTDAPVTFTVEAMSAAGTSPPSPASSPVVAAPAGSRFVASTPVRVLDTRDGTGGHRGPVRGGETVTTTVDAVPTDATAVVLNVTATGQTEPTFVTVWPGRQGRPLVSSLNPRPGVAAMPAMVTTRLGAGRTISLYDNSGSVDLVADVVGWFVPATPARIGSLYAPTGPTRVLDTRSGIGTAGRPFGSGETRRLYLPELPAGATAAVLDVTATGVASPSFVTVWPAGTPRPLASNLNPQPGLTAANQTVAALSPSGMVDVYNNSGPADLVIDLVGTYGPAGAAAGGAEYVPVGPQRLYDTRDGTGGVTGPITGGAATPLAFAGVGPIPAGAVAVDANLTVVAPTADGHTTVWPGGPEPATSVLNYPAGTVVANRTAIGLAGGGALVRSTAPAIHYVFDVSGWYQAPAGSG